MLRAASNAGVADPAVCIRLPNGTEYTVGARAGFAAPTETVALKPTVAVKPAKARPGRRVAR
jgi:hypothetical protein